MTRHAVPVLAFWAGALIYVWAPSVKARVVAWWRPEPLAKFSKYQGLDQ